MKQIDKEYLVNLGAVFLEENIFYIENFFSENLLKDIQKEIYDEKEWIYTDVSGSTFKDLMCIQNENTINEIQNTYNNFLNWPSFQQEKDFEIHAVKWIQRRGDSTIEPRNGMGPHWDGDPSPKYVGQGAGTMQIPNRVKWGCVIYLNDNYEGGEIYYPKKNIQYKPKAGSLICHIGDDPEYIHAVNLIGPGQMRFNMIFNMMYGDVNKPENGETVYDFNR